MAVSSRALKVTDKVIFVPWCLALSLARSRGTQEMSTVY